MLTTRRLIPWLSFLTLCLGIGLVLPAQEVVTILGTGAAGWSGDGEPGPQAKCNEPFGLVVGPDGAIYVCETKSHVIRRIDAKTQIVTTVAGTGGKSGYAGDGGPATAALLFEPYEIRFDKDGHMFFVEMRAKWCGALMPGLESSRPSQGRGKPASVVTAVPPRRPSSSSRTRSCWMTRAPVHL